jgi:hypothetical protein
VIFVSFGIFGCASPALIAADSLSQAEKAAIARELGDALRDGPTARWRWPKISPMVLHGAGEGYYCGWINSKNAFGAYTGYTPFIVDIGNAGGRRVLTSPHVASPSEVNECTAVGYDTSAPPPAD